MNYKQIYNQLILYRQNNPIQPNSMYTQRHHIIPRSIDHTKEKEKSNLVHLTAREHFIAHLLLVKIYEKLNDIINYKKMLYAFNLMCIVHKNQKQYSQIHFNSHLYQRLRLKARDFQSQHKLYKEKNGMYKKHWITNIISHQNKIIADNQIIPTGWKLGKYISSQLKELACKNLQKLRSVKRKWIKNIKLNICKLIPVTQQTPIGWQPGSIIHFSQEGFHKLKTQQKLSGIKLEERIKLLTPIYNDYIKLKLTMKASQAFQLLQIKYNYKASWHHFLYDCNHYLPNYLKR